MNKLLFKPVTNSIKSYDFQINDIVGEFEQEKFEMQKQHTKSIQEILDDTNARLQKMEKEYSQQTLSTVSGLMHKVSH